MHCRYCGREGDCHVPEMKNGECMECGKRTLRKAKPADEILVDGLLWGTGVFCAGLGKARGIC